MTCFLQLPYKSKNFYLFYLLLHTQCLERTCDEVGARCLMNDALRNVHLLSFRFEVAPLGSHKSHFAVLSTFLKTSCCLVKSHLERLSQREEST